MRIVKLTKETTKNILENMLKRSPSQYGEYESRVQAIIQNIKENGDEALFSYTKQFDKANINASNVKVTDEEFEEAYKAVDPALLDVIRKALVNIESYHELQKQNSWFKSTPQGTMLGQKVTPLEKVGVYVPGGKAVYPSSVLMNIMPAKVAGVDKIIMTTPCNAEGKVNPAVLVAAKEAGADEVGGICGGLGDLLGCLIQGYAPNPLILVSSVLAGVIPAVFKKYVFRDKVNTWKIAVMLIVHGIVGSLGFTVVGLHVYYATPWSVLYATRVIQTIALTIANTILVSVLYQSALTTYVNQVFALQRTREV